MNPPDHTRQRAAMVSLIRSRAVKDPRILDAMLAVRRHCFIPGAFRHLESDYGDYPCPIGFEQTISQPYIVTCAPDDVPPALVTQLAEGGRMAIPVGTDIQRLVLLRKRSGQIEQAPDIGVRFVPMIDGKE